MSEELDCNCNCETEYCELIEGNEIDIDLQKCDSEIKADIKVGKKCCVRVWGQVTDCEDEPVKDALVKLLRAYYCHGKIKYKGIAHTITDCMGFYQFDICKTDCYCTDYKIIVGKANTYKERVIDGDGICYPCID